MLLLRYAKKMVVRSILFSLALLVVIGTWLLPASVALAQQVAVPITWHRQEHSLSCETATLQMALGTHNIAVTEDELITHLTFDPTPRSNGVWGDPYTGFVGSIDGRMLQTGYGVYWDSIAALGKHYAHTQVITNGSATVLAQQVAAGNPVIIWGHSGNPTGTTWQTPAGKTIQGINGEHTRVVYGFDGTVKNPTRFYLMDPDTGQHTWLTAELMSNWGSFQHSGVVVFPKKPRWVRVPGETKVWEINREGSLRQWVTTWARLVTRDGAGDIAPIDLKSLAAYRVGQAID